MTADLAAQRLQRTPFSIRPRVAELHKLGLLEPSTERAKGDSGMTVHVWQLTQAGQNA
jgi:predicted ArsR family transcriptional regulator